MYDIDLLEKEWRRYKIKQTLPWIGFIFILFLLLLYILNRNLIFSQIEKFFPKDKNISAKIVKVDATPSVIVKEIIQEIKVPEKCIEVNKTEIIVKEITEVEEKVIPKIVPAVVNDTLYNEEIDKEIAEEESIKEENNSKPKMNIEFSEEEVDKKEIDKPHRRKYLNIIVTDKDSLDDNNKIFDTLSIVEDRYNKNNNYRDALYLADGYYEKGDYAISQKWALLSNSLNSNSEDSWLLFAKSKAKLGDYKVAEDILEAYLKENSSKKAEELLKKMQLGKF